MTNLPDETGATTAYRLWQLEEEMKTEVRPAIAQVALMGQELHGFIAAQRDNNTEMRDSMKSLRNTLIGFAFSISAAAVVFAFAAFELTK